MVQFNGKVLVKEKLFQFKIRREAMSGLALIYRKHLADGDVPQATKKAITWIKDKILHGYYMVGMEDRYLFSLIKVCLYVQSFTQIILGIS